MGEILRMARWNGQGNLRYLDNGSVPAGDGLGGVRPSSGAAMWEGGGALMKSDASAHSVLAAPEDGRTPMTSPSALTEPQPVLSCEPRGASVGWGEQFRDSRHSSAADNGCSFSGLKPRR